MEEHGERGEGGFAFRILLRAVLDSKMSLMPGGKRAYNTLVVERGMKIKKYVSSSDAILCKGRLKPTKKGRSFCWKVRQEGKGEHKQHRIEFFSTRTAQPIGFKGPGCTFVKTPQEAEVYDYLNRQATGWGVQQCLIDTKSRGRTHWQKQARQMMREIEKAAK